MTEEQQEEQFGDSWLDEADLSLESFMQEDALLDAIRDAPEIAESAVPMFEDFTTVDIVGADQESHLVSENGGARHAASSSTSGAELQTSVVEEEFESLRMKLSGDSTGVSGRRVVQNVQAESAAAEPSQRQQIAATAGVPGQSPTTSQRQKAGQPSKAVRQRSLPWRGGLLTCFAIVGIVLWGPELWEDPATTSISAQFKIPEIQVPLADPVDISMVDNIANRTQRGRVGSIMSVQRSSNASIVGTVALEGNTSSDRSERRKSRIRKGASDLS